MIRQEILQSNHLEGKGEKYPNESDKLKIWPWHLNFRHLCWIFVAYEAEYYTDSDVFLADSGDFADITDFVADILTFFSRRLGEIENHVWAHCRARILSNEVRDTQQNPRHSAKNNVAIRMIATFMPKKILHILICLLIPQQNIIHRLIS